MASPNVASHAVDDQIEVAVEPLDHVAGAEAAHELPRRGGIANQSADARAARTRELDRHAPDAAGRAGDQHPLAEYEATDLDRPQRGHPGGGQGGGLRVGYRVGYHRQRGGCNRGQLRPSADVH